MAIYLFTANKEYEEYEENKNGELQNSFVCCQNMVASRSVYSAGAPYLALYSLVSAIIGLF